MASLSLALACERTSTDAPDAGAPNAPAMPTTRVDVLSRYLDASILQGLSDSLAQTGFNLCTQAYITGSGGGPAPSAELRDTYLDECAKLPIPAQKCLGVLYASGHVPECADVARALDPAARAAVNRLQAMRPTTR